MKNPTLFVIADYGIGDPAFSEVILQLRRLIPDAFIYPHSTPPFSTVNTGFWLYQLALSNAPQNTYIFSNTAPRLEDHKAQQNNRGEKLMYAELTNGFEIVAVNAGYVFSFVKPFIKRFHEATVSHEGSQFRSRDIFPEAVKKMIAKDPTLLGTKGSIEAIPEVPAQSIASIDGYGNIKTTTRLSAITLQPGTKIQITIGDVTHKATSTDGMFHVHHGELAFAPGSSGHEDKFMEISVRGGSAATLFGHPKTEQPFSITE